jgi:hypothetical protein
VAHETALATYTDVPDRTSSRQDDPRVSLISIESGMFAFTIGLERVLLVVLVFGCGPTERGGTPAPPGPTGIERSVAHSPLPAVTGPAPIVVGHERTHGKVASFRVAGAKGFVRRVEDNVLDLVQGPGGFSIVSGM